MPIKYCLEYVWIDGVGELRSKIKILLLGEKYDTFPLELVPVWNFDGSSTSQSAGPRSDVLLKPIRLYKNPFFENYDAYLVLCECMNTDMTPHQSNHRSKCEITKNEFDNFENWFGIEQEYVIFERSSEGTKNGYNLPYKWDSHQNPELGGQNPYYCSVGGDRNFGRKISNMHLIYCLEAGISICGTNAEVMASQWEFQIGVCDPLHVSDDLWMARYILHRTTEEFNCWVSFHPKPYTSEWNGSGAHTNYSNKMMREENGYNSILDACIKLKQNHEQHMLSYGKDNQMRLSGTHETSDPNTFTYDVGNRNTSVRIPINVFLDGKGYLEDRRPGSNIDPYIVTELIVRTVCKD